MELSASALAAIQQLINAGNARVISALDAKIDIDRLTKEECQSCNQRAAEGSRGQPGSSCREQGSCTQF